MFLAVIEHIRNITVTPPGGGGGDPSGANTFIGGVATSIPTKAALASKLLILESDISFFAVAGNDIKATINVSYALLNFNFRDDVDITYFIDYAGKVTGLGSFAFSHDGSLNTSKLKYILLPAATYAEQNAFSHLYKAEVIELNSLTSLNGVSHFKNTSASIYLKSLVTIGGSNTTDSEVFFNDRLVKATVYLPPSFATVNGGAEEPDIVGARFYGATIRYLSNTTLPSAITDLSVSSIGGKTLKLNFTPPASANTLDGYDVYANGVFKNRIQGSGQYVTGLELNTSYDIEVKPRDVLYNKSTSNIVTQITNASLFFPVDNTRAYFKFENKVYDSIGVNRGLATNITYAAGIAGQAAVFNGSSSKIEIPHTDDLSFGSNPFSIVLNIYRNAAPGSNGYWYVSKRSGASSNIEYQIIEFGGKFGVYLFGGNSSANSIIAEITTPFSLATDHTVVITHTGSNLPTGIKIYVDAVLKTTATSSTGTYTGMTSSTTAAPLVFGYRGAWSNLGYFNGKMDEVTFINKEITQAEVTQITNTLQGGASLI